MVTTIKGQVLASTSLDTQGERFDKQYLEDLVANLPTRMPLNQHHEHGLPTVGVVENFRVESEDDGWVLKGDVTFEGEPPTMGEFSFSTTELVHRAKEPLFLIYVPYPHYRDSQLLNELAASNPNTSVGKWVKKSAELAEIALVVSTASLLLGPAWKKIYDEQVHPRLAAVATAVKEAIQGKGGTRARTDYLQPVRCNHYEGTIELYFIPTEQAALDLVYGFAVKDGIDQSSALINEDWELSHKAIKRIVHVFEVEACRYQPIQIIYVNGDTRRVG